MPDNYFARYLPLLLHFAIAFGVAGAIVTLSYFIGQHKPNRAKLSPYECGVQPIGDARGRFSVKFYLVAMLFILFDVEAVFLYPWAVVFREGGLAVFAEMLVFVVVLFLGYAYLWKKGAFDWS